MVTFETNDNQLEFDKILFDNFDNDDTFNYRYEQIREVVPRHARGESRDRMLDPIIKSSFIYANGFMFAVSLRGSGDADLYWNMQLKETVVGGNYYAQI